MSLGFQLTPEAQADLDEIADYLVAEAGPAVSIKVVTEIRKSFRELAEMPGKGHFNEDLRPASQVLERLLVSDRLPLAAVADPDPRRHSRCERFGESVQRRGLE